MLRGVGRADLPLPVLGQLAGGALLEAGIGREVGGDFPAGFAFAGEHGQAAVPDEVRVADVVVEGEVAEGDVFRLGSR